ncbi:DUF3302 domain-containing protein [Roseibium denhamense]|uniref:DUF3302 domain-containing protein n=1 Tax=Roseibium denhamense TaxID=76305 RepID=A0ABY1P8Z6_9HYPH|nr:DUF3302 domain-containing protein [Roseibium denhamense]MTI04499.1 DUF3302 domain-containing protein [Roseibium denhamense]SMP28707.1 Protein of unknown function [Roseibium denhamense]
MSLIDFELDGYDYATFALLLLCVIVFFYVMVTLGGLPGKLAEKRNHPHAESVKLGGWIGLFTVFPWIHALIWAYHDSLTIDVRKFPKTPGGSGDAKPAGDAPAEIVIAAGDQAPAGANTSEAASGRAGTVARDAKGGASV